MHSLLNASAYGSTVRAAHGLVDLLKKSRPDCRPQVEELQAIVTRAHSKLHELDQLAQAEESQCRCEGRDPTPNPSLDCEAATALTDLEAAHRSLRDLTHPAKRRVTA